MQKPRGRLPTNDSARDVGRLTAVLDPNFGQGFASDLLEAMMLQLEMQMMLLVI